jgi:cytochrome c oxidase subunit 2
MRPAARASAGLLIALAFACAGCAGPQSALDPHGTPARDLLHLMSFIMVTCAVVWVLVVTVLAAALWRRQRARPEPLTLDAVRQRRMAVVVGACVIATAAVISLFTLASYAVTRSLPTAGDDAVSIRVRGLQWWWEVTYLDPQRGQLFVTANEIHVPVGRKVRIDLAAADVIHSLWVPSLAGKHDLIPGRDNAITFTAERAGVYRGQCAEFCGMSHARMAMIVVAQSPRDYDVWQRAQASGAVPPQDDEQEAGQRVFMAKACSACHTVRGTAAVGKLGPDLTHVASRRSIAAGVLDTTRGALAAWIADPQTIKPGNNMPRIALSADELNAVSAYLAGLR